MRDSRTALSFVFGLVGGILILTTLLIFLPLAYSPYGYYGPFFFGILGLAMGLTSGVFVIIGATMAFVRPQQGVMWGIVTIVFGSLSMFGLGGFVIGMALAITSGALAIVTGSSTAVRMPATQRACTSCGMLSSIEFRHCPHCGHEMAPLPR